MTESVDAVATRVQRGGVDQPVFVDDDDVAQLDATLLRTGVGTVYFDCTSPAPTSLLEQLVVRGDAPSWTGNSWESLWDVLDEVRSSWQEPICLIGRRVDLAAHEDLVGTTELASMTALFAQDLTMQGPPVHLILTLSR